MPGPHGLGTFLFPDQSLSPVEWAATVMYELDESLWGMRWVPAMPGSKNYVLEEAQKAIEILRQEIRRLRRENAELRSGDVESVRKPEGAEAQRNPTEGSAERREASSATGEYLVVTGVLKILARS